jgi:hypothetical protein
LTRERQKHAQLPGRTPSRISETHLSESYKQERAIWTGDRVIVVYPVVKTEKALALPLGVKAFHS